MKFNLPLLISKVGREVKKNGFEIYIVGGAIRDLLTGKPTYDWDFTTNATPEQILKIFPDAFYDNKFGTVGIAVEDLVKKYKLTTKDLKGIDPQRPFEITTFRSETGYQDSRHPDKVVWGKSLEEDLKRRDFTINAMALKVTDYGLPITDYEIIDPFGGQQDLKNKLIRAVGDPTKRFSEDALRLVRAIRIAAELGFTIEPKTLAAIKKNAKTLSKVSFERIQDEFLKILKSSYPADGIKLLTTTHLLQIILPEMLATQGIQQAGHHTKDVWNHSLDSLANCPSPDPIVRLATFLHDVGKPVAYRQKNGKITFYGHEVVGARITQKIAERLKLPKKDQEKLVTLVRFHMFAYNPEMTDAAIRRFIRNVGLENINDMMILRIGDRIGGGSRATSWRLRELQERIGKVLYTPMQVSDLKINGNDVMKVLNIKPGPRVGKILQKLFEEVLEDASKNTKEYLLKRIKELS
jgi:tRNA nucleotidyltransferase (CCA-adding enzyme)